MRIGRRLHGAARAILYALILWAPILLGSNRPIFWVLNGLAVSLILLLFVFGEAEGGRVSPAAWRSLAAVAAVLALVPLWMLVQAVRWTPAVLHHPAWTDFALGDSARGAISVNPAATYASIAVFLPTAFLALFAARLGLSDRRARFFLRVIVTSALVLAGYGLLARSLAIPQVPLLQSSAYPGSLTSFFVNRNTTATYLAVGLTATFALIGEAYEKLGASGTRMTVSRGLVELPRVAGFDLLAAFVLTTALANTASRGGILAAGAGMLAVAGLTRLRGSDRAKRRSSRRIERASAVLSVLAVFLTGLALAGELFFQRLEDTTVDLGTRLALYRDTIAAILARPVLGHGGGTFADIFPLFHSDAVNSGVVWNRAHDVYLQVAAELGLPVLLLLLALILWVCVVVVGAARARRGPAPAAIAALGTVTVVAIHSLVDFSLQIQAVGLLFSAVVGLGFGEALRLRDRVLSGAAREAAAPVLSVETGLEIRDFEVPMMGPAARS